MRDSNLRATGVPAHIMNLKRMDSIEGAILALTESVQRELRLVHQTLPQNIADFVVRSINDNFRIEGVTPIKPAYLDTFRTDLLRQIEVMMSHARSEQSVNVTKTAEPDQTPSWWRSFEWSGEADGRIAHFVPKGWMFPKKINLKTLWDLWWLGDMVSSH